MHLRLSIIFIYTSFFLLITTNAEQTFRRDARFRDEDHYHLREQSRRKDGRFHDENPYHLREQSHQKDGRFRDENPYHLREQSHRQDGRFHDEEPYHLREQSHLQDGRFPAEEPYHLRETERNPNTLHYEQLLTNRHHPTRLNPFIHDHRSDWINSPTLQTYGRHTVGGHGSGVWNRLQQTAPKTSHPYFDSQSSRIDSQSSRINPNARRRISKFRMRKNKGNRKGSSNPIATNTKTMRTMPGNERWYPRETKGTLDPLQWISQPSLTQGQQRMTRSSCTGGKVWRRGQCRCPYSSNWDTTLSKCVCIYGTYKDTKGNCRPYL